jgi:hypothetical protein
MAVHTATPIKLRRRKNTSFTARNLKQNVFPPLIAIDPIFLLFTDSPAAGLCAPVFRCPEKERLTPTLFNA